MLFYEGWRLGVFLCGIWWAIIDSKIANIVRDCQLLFQETGFFSTMEHDGKYCQRAAPTLIFRKYILLLFLLYLKVYCLWMALDNNKTAVGMQNPNEVAKCQGYDKYWQVGVKTLREQKLFCQSLFFWKVLHNVIFQCKRWSGGIGI